MVIFNLIFIICNFFFFIFYLKQSNMSKMINNKRCYTVKHLLAILQPYENITISQIKILQLISQESLFMLGYKQKNILYSSFSSISLFFFPIYLWQTRTKIRFSFWGLFSSFILLQSFIFPLFIPQSLFHAFE